MKLTPLSKRRSKSRFSNRPFYPTFTPPRTIFDNLEVARFGFGLKTEVVSEFIQNQTVRNFVICIDDLERKEKDVTGAALLGFITSLREERNCKVILLYNDSEIPDDLTETISDYREKVIDREVTYTPSVEENFRIIFPEGSDHYLPSTGGSVDLDPYYGGDDRNVLDLLKSLDVTNIRVIRKTKDALDFFQSPLGDYPKTYPQFMRQVVSTFFDIVILFKLRS